VMDALGPIPEVRNALFDVLGRTNLHAQLSWFAKMTHGLLLTIPKARPFMLSSERELILYSSGW
jgi:hypothetical protein